MKGKIITGRNVLHGENLQLIQDGCIVVAGEKIEEVGPKNEIISGGKYSGFDVIDTGDATLMPGLIDCHNHLSLDARRDGYLEMMDDSECELTIRAINTMEADLRSGVTTARCLGDRFYIDVICRDAVKSGRLKGPKLLTSGIGMRALHGHGFVGLPHSGAEEIRSTARKNLARGADIIKIFVTGAVSQNGFVPGYLSFEEIRTAVEEAARLDKRTAAHCIGGEGLVNCVNAGVDAIEHGYFMSEKDIELMLKNDRWIVHTPNYFMDEERNSRMAPERAKLVRQQRQAMIDCVSGVIKSGLKFAIGTDGLHEKLANEVGYVTALGASAVDAVKGVTVNAARLCGIESHTGCIKEGCFADVIAVDGNPLKDVGALARVKLVIQNGNLIQNTAGN